MSDNSLAVFAKRDCPTCQLVAPVLRQLVGRDGSADGVLARTTRRSRNSVAA